MSNLTTSFRATTINRMDIRPLGTGGLSTKKSFRVVIDYASGVDFNRYQYRQRIKGSASIEEGSYTGSPTVANWRSAGRPAASANKAFGVPPSGITGSFQEDGAREDGVVVHYGRNIPGTFAHGNIPEDRYFTEGGRGRYRATDNVGLEFRRPRFVFNGRMFVRSGLRVRIDIIFQGRIIDTHNGDRLMKTLHWGVKGDLILP